MARASAAPVIAAGTAGATRGAGAGASGARAPASACAGATGSFRTSGAGARDGRAEGLPAVQGHGDNPASDLPVGLRPVRRARPAVQGVRPALVTAPARREREGLSH